MEQAGPTAETQQGYATDLYRQISASTRIRHPDVRYEDRQDRLRLFVIKGRGSALLGRDWQMRLGLYQNKFPGMKTTVP